MPAFGKALLDTLNLQEISQSSFSRSISHPVAWINQIIHGHRTPPLDEVEKWAGKLGLEGRERQRFIDLAALAHLPPAVEARFLRILDEHDQLLADYKGLAKRAAAPREKYKP